MTRNCTSFTAEFLPDPAERCVCNSKVRGDVYNARNHVDNPVPVTPVYYLLRTGSGS
jgi:hypothetical protein